MEIALFEDPEIEPKYFVGSLSFTTTDRGLNDYFSKFGQVISSNVIIDKMTGKSKGFAFVTMRHLITNLSQINNSELDGRTIYVDQARPSGNFPRLLSSRKSYDAELKDVVEKIEIGFTLVDDEIKVVELFEDKKFQYIDDLNNKYGLLHTFNSENKRLKESIQEFEYLINKSSLKEVELQRFFESNQDLILNEDYKKAHSKIILQKENNDITIPDFILEPHNSTSLCDLLELKLPNVKLYTQKKNRLRYSSSVFEAFAQLREYAAFFEDAANRAKIAEKYGLNLYRPNMIVVIGRNKDIEPVLLKRVESDIPGLRLTTYDNILEKMKRKKH